MKQSFNINLQKVKNKDRGYFIVVLLLYFIQTFVSVKKLVFMVFILFKKMVKGAPFKGYRHHA